MRQFVPNFLSDVSSKYYLNRFTAEKVITKIKNGELFIATQCSCQLCNSHCFPGKTRRRDNLIIVSGGTLNSAHPLISTARRWNADCGHKT